MMCDKNKRIKGLETALSQLITHSKLFLKTHVSNREQLKKLIAQAKKALGGD